MVDGPKRKQWSYGPIHVGLERAAASNPIPVGIALDLRHKRYNQRMLVAVTGATGFLGRYIVNDLISNGHTCRCWYRPSSDQGGFANDGQGIQWIRGQLGEPDATQSLVHAVDAVVHCALDRQDGWSPADRDLIDFVQTNVVGSVRLMQLARSSGVRRFVFISTCAVHDVILSDRPLNEAHPLWPYSHYGAHKAAVEKFVHSFGLPRTNAPQGWDICSLRPTGIYGCDHPIEKSRWYGLIRDIVEDRPVDLPQGGKEVHAADVAKAVRCLLATEPGVVAGQSYNCCDMYIALQDVAQIAKQIVGSTSEITRKNRGPKNQIDTSKLRALGMSFGGKSLLEETVRALVRAVKAAD